MTKSTKRYMNTTRQIKITGVPDEMKSQIENVALHLEEDVSGLLRPVLKNWLASLPEKIKTMPTRLAGE